jgi:hypothetical protein
MPCYSPLSAFQSPAGGKLTFSEKTGFKPLTIPCGRCLGCKIESSRKWAVRAVHELKFHDQSCFLTLTYNDEHLPEGGTLEKSDWVKFMKRLRKHVFKTTGKTIRFLMCGEYGERDKRPHYHAVIFGYDFTDKVHYKNSPKSGAKLFRSPTLEKLWADKDGNPIGFCDIGDVTFDSAQYVAGYVTKKITGATAHEHYQSIDPETGEITQRIPEFLLMSRRPGLGYQWIEKYHSDVYPNDKVHINGKQSKPPRYYDKFIEKLDPVQFDIVKIDRENKSLKFENDNPDADERQLDQQIILDQKRKNRERDFS